MADMYFVKEPNNVVSGSMIAAGLGGVLHLGKLSVLYQGQDEQLAKEIAKNLKQSVLSTYNFDTERGFVNVQHAHYRDGKCGMAHSRGLSAENPMQSLLERLITDTTRRESLAEVFEEFTHEEVVYLNSLKQRREAA